MVSSVSSSNSTNSAGSATGNTASVATSAADMQNQFLTLLIAQLKNQDPMNPMDNAQMTSQMAQISTVTGIEKLNDTVQSVTGQFASQQMQQGVALIGRSVLTEGNTLTTNSEGMSSAAFDLGNAAASVKVNITDTAGQLVDSVNLGSLSAGRNYFNWNSAQYQGDPSNLRYQVEAANGQSPVSATAFAASSVIATTVNNGKVMLELSNGTSMDYNKVQSVF